MNSVELGQIPLLVRVGEASRLFGVGKPLLMSLVKAGRLRTIRLSPRGHHRFTTFEVASVLGMTDLIPKVALLVNHNLIRDLDAEVSGAVGKAQTAFRHELNSELNKLRDDFRQLIREATQNRTPPRPVPNKPIKGLNPQASQGGSY